jgi:hypothetical protein
VRFFPAGREGTPVGIAIFQQDTQVRSGNVGFFPQDTQVPWKKYA